MITRDDVTEQELRAVLSVRSLRALSTAINLLATEIETTSAGQQRADAWAASIVTYADRLLDAAGVLKGRKQ